MSLPMSGRASTYSDKFEHRRTATGHHYSHHDFSAALLPRSNWYAPPMGSRLKLTHIGRSVMVEINDRGSGAVDGDTGIDPDPERVLDPIRAAKAALLGVTEGSITDADATVISMDRIEVAPPGTPLGSWTGRWCIHAHSIGPVR